MIPTQRVQYPRLVPIDLKIHLLVNLCHLRLQSPRSDKAQHLLTNALYRLRLVAHLPTPKVHLAFDENCQHCCSKHRYLNES